jgi:hypothetical protein
MYGRELTRSRKINQESNNGYFRRPDKRDSKS